MQKAPDRDRGMPHSLLGEVVGKSDGCGYNFLACDLLFGAEPVFLLVTVLPAARLIEFVRAHADLVFELVRLPRYRRRRFLRKVRAHGVALLVAQTYARTGPGSIT
jgi:hypothetical protein